MYGCARPLKACHLNMCRPSKRADIGVYNLYITWDRAQAVFFSYPYDISPLTFTSPLPQLRLNNLNFFEPFDKWFWLTIALNILVISLLIHFVFKSRFESIWVMTAILLRQQTSINARYRRLIFAWMMVGVVVSTSYSGVVYSLMSTTLERERIETLVDVIRAQKSKKITPVAIENSPTIAMIKVGARCRYLLQLTIDD